MKAIGFLFLTLFVLGCSTSATSKNDSPETSAPTIAAPAWNATQWTQATYTMVDSFDGVSNPCGLTTEQAKALPQPIKALLDEHYTQQQPVYSQKTAKERLASLPKSCDKDCSCSYYVGFFEHLEHCSIELSPAEKKQQARMVQLQSREKKNAACKKDPQWFCQSATLKDILRTL